jgi:tRNA threonylcarbamoyladenosine biosynthesis protein TsaE
MKVMVKNEGETYKLGKFIGERLSRGAVLSLNGDLGAGKTHMTKGIAEGMGIKDYITSPSFTILNTYDGDIPLYHFDVYRIDDIREMYEIGFDEYIYGNGVCVIEWGSMVEELIPENSIKLSIVKLEDDVREIEILNLPFQLGEEWR